MSDDPKNPLENQGIDSGKKLLEKGPLSGIAVPLAIILIGGVIIFGVTKMLSTGKNHRDLVQEMNSKTFGNRWIAAYELSKFLASQKIPQEDMPWVIENLSQVFRETVDPRTRNFIVLALGSLNNPLCLPVLNEALKDEDPQVKFNAVVALGNMNSSPQIKWDLVEALLESEDTGLKQAVLLATAAHQRPDAQDKAITLLNANERSLRYAAAIVLIKFKNPLALPIIEEILGLSYDVSKSGEFNGVQVEGLKMNLLENLEKSNWKELSYLLERVQQDDPNVKVSTKAKQVLKILKN